MRCSIILIAFLALFETIVADIISKILNYKINFAVYLYEFLLLLLDINDILPDFVENVRQIEQDYFAQAKAAKSLNLDSKLQSANYF